MLTEPQIPLLLEMANCGVGDSFFSLGGGVVPETRPRSCVFADDGHHRVAVEPP